MKELQGYQVKALKHVSELILKNYAFLTTMQSFQCQEEAALGCS